MSTQLEDLNKAIQDEDVTITGLLAVITKAATDLAALKTKVDAGGTPVDLSAQLAALQSHLASLTTGTQQLKDADTSATA